MIGKSIGPYQLLAELGRGGMGEVYRARDTALGRDVALKILPELFAADADRLARFEREAQALASLNHPNIAQVYAIAAIPPSANATSGGRAIVMELVEGEDLSERIARGSIPLDEALPLARQIALALEAAHDAGIIHRDLKPANIKIRPDGTAKVLDFGLAKAFGSDATTSASSLANSPTLTAAAFAQGYGAPGTQMGVILGTAAYMSPEQAKGRIVDRRADVWAFGVVLYEMLTGRRAFGGDDLTEVMAAVIRDTPDPAALPAGTPPAVRRLLRRCLEKDVRKRLRDMGDAGVELDEAMAATPVDEGMRTVAGVTHPAARRSPFAIAGAVLLLVALAAGAAWSLKPAPVADDRPLTRFTLMLDDGQRMANLNNPNLAWSRDGRRVAYRADGVIFVRSLDDVRPREVVKSQGGGTWFSPDGNTVLYRTTSGLSKVLVAGGPSQELVSLADVSGADWGDDGTIVYSDGKRILKIPDAGGEPTVLLTVPEGAQVSRPQVLPTGRAVLYALSDGGERSIFVKTLEGPASDVRKVLPGVTHARYVTSGHLIYPLDNRIMAVPFDAGRLELTGTAVPVAESVYVSSSGQAQLAVSDTGALAYVASEEVQALQLSWVEPQGQARPVLTMPRNYSDLVLSRDGRRAAIHIWDQDNDIWVADLVRGGLTRLTFTKGEEETPVWSFDGKDLAYAAAMADGKRGVFTRPADGSASAVERKIWEDQDHFHVNDWSPDRRTILVEVRRASTINDIVAVDVEAGTVRNLLASPYPEYNARFSPDGKWLAYVSEESGRAEVYVQPYPGLDARVPVSTAGGREPVWSHDGRKLFFRAAESVMEAVVTSVAPLEFAAPKVMFRDTFTRTQGTLHTHFDVAPDGRFLMIENPRANSIGRQEIHIVLNWADALKRLAPVKK